MGVWDALRGRAVIVEGPGPVPEVVARFCEVATAPGGMFRSAVFWGRVMDPGEWLDVTEMGDALDDPGRVLAVCTRRPDLAHDIVALDLSGSVGLAFFVDGAPDMGAASFGRSQARRVARKVAAGLRGEVFLSY